MKSLLIGSIILFSINLNAQEMELINRTITELFVATDTRDWQKVEQIFADQVVLDYSSMNGNPAVELSPSQITGAWKGILPGFESTHHQIGNFITKVDENKASVFVYGTATHYLSDDQGSVWTVVGSYDFDLIKTDNKWRISSMKFNFKYQDGNTSLPEKAIEIAASSN